MKCYDAPCDGENPYPEIQSGGLRVTFESDLILYRPNEPFEDGETGAPLQVAGDVYLVGAPFRISWVDDLYRATANTIVVPAGFITDLTSVPPLLRGIVSRAGPWLEAAIVHDFLYVAWQDVPGRGHLEADRRFADAIFLAGMEARGVGKLLRTLIFWAVRAFGAASFHRPVPNRFANCRDETLLALSAAARCPSSS